MALPAVIMAYKEKGNVAKLVVYGIAGIAVVYFGYKVYKQIKKFGASLGAVVEGVKEGIEEIKQYGMTRPLTPKDTAEIITKRASKEPDKPYLVDETIYNALKEQGYSLPKNVKPYKPDYSKVERDQSIIGTKLGLWMPKKEKKEAKRVKPTYKTNKEIMAIEGKRWQARYEARIKAKPTYKTNKELAKIYGKRWQAIARYYKRRRPASPLPKSMRIKPILKPAPKRVPAVLPRKRMVIAL